MGIIFVPEIITVTTEDGYILGEIANDPRPLPEKSVYVFAPVDNLQLEQDDLVAVVAILQKMNRLHGDFINRPLVLDDLL